MRRNYSYNAEMQEDRPVFLPVGSPHPVRHLLQTEDDGATCHMRRG